MMMKAKPPAPAAGVLSVRPSPTLTSMGTTKETSMKKTKVKALPKDTMEAARRATLSGGVRIGGAKS